MNSQVFFYNMKRINYNKQFTDEKDAQIVLEAIKSKLITSGNFVNLFEKKICRFLKVKHAITCINGTAGLDLAFRSIGLEPENNVVMPVVNFVASYSMAKKIGAKIYLADVDPITGQMTPETLLDCIKKNKLKKIKAVVTMYLGGYAENVINFYKLKKKYSFYLIEDACHAFGAKYQYNNNKLMVGCCKHSDVSVFSFHPVKTITTGEGGMIFTDDDNLAEKCRKLRNMYFQEDKRFVHEKLGWNLRMTNIQASLGVAQLERLDDFVLKKRWIGHKYNELLKELDGIQLPLPKTNYSENIYWVYGVVLDDTIKFSASEAIKLLTKHNVGSRPFFFPIHQQPVLKKLGLFLDEKYPVAEKLYQRGFYIPSGLALNEKQLEEVASILKSIIKSK